jgi:hypothetical protein
VSDYRLDDRISVPSRGKGLFLLASVSRPAVRPNWLPVQWVPDVVSQSKVRPGRDADHLAASSAEVKND